MEVNKKKMRGGEKGKRGKEEWKKEGGEKW